MVHLVGFAIEIILRCTALWTSNLTILYFISLTIPEASRIYSTYKTQYVNAINLIDDTILQIAYIGGSYNINIKLEEQERTRIQ